MMGTIRALSERVRERRLKTAYSRVGALEEKAAYSKKLEAALDREKKLRADIERAEKKRKESGYVANVRKRMEGVLGDRPKPSRINLGPGPFGRRGL